jgi:hypothetical protein
MFRRKAQGSGEPMPVVGPSAPKANSAYEPFRYSAQSMLNFPSRHPFYEGYSTWYTLKEGGEVAVITPFIPPPESPRFRLADLPMETWVELSDAQGRRIPLALYVDASGVSGRWLP